MASFMVFIIAGMSGLSAMTESQLRPAAAGPVLNVTRSAFRVSPSRGTCSRRTSIVPSASIFNSERFPRELSLRVSSSEISKPASVRVTDRLDENVFVIEPDWVMLLAQLNISAMKASGDAAFGSIALANCTDDDDDARTRTTLLCLPSLLPPDLINDEDDEDDEEDEDDCLEE